MALLHGTIVDATSEASVEAKVHILSSNGKFLAPENSILKCGPGLEFFYADGSFEVEVPVGQVDVLVERGTEFRPWRREFTVSTEGVTDIEIILDRWTNLPDQGWHPGNTHLHYDQHEMRPDERLRFDSMIEGYGVTAVSILQRRDLPYASNRYPIGLFTDLCTAHHIVDVGEESRHNISTRDMDYGSFGYGHVMFISIRNLVEPVSRGTLVSDFDPDFPPLCWACDDAREQDGTVIWCHNGRGMEAPVAAVLGKIHAFNLFDPWWQDPEYSIYYALLNTGLHLPASTGTDWFVCSNNRVYCQTNGPFSYEAWIQGLHLGRTFITNGAELFLNINDAGPGSVLEREPDDGPLSCNVRWSAHTPVHVVELIMNGELVADKKFPEGSTNGSWTSDIEVTTNGWLAARLSGRTRDSFNQAQFTHTSPVYIDTGIPGSHQAQAASRFVRSIDQSLGWINHQGRYASDQQRDAVAELFRAGQARFQSLV